jgi:uncharacterized membrane protein YfcA
LLSHVTAVGVPASTWIEAGILIPFATLGVVAGRPLGDRLSADAFARLAILLLAVAGCTLLPLRKSLLPVINVQPARAETGHEV